MPTYDYACAANGRVVEVSHRMSEDLITWGELCAKAGIERGNTPADAPVKRLATGGNIVSGKLTSEPMAPCATGSCCSGGFCGLG
jgi:hypothetical protein